MTDSAFAKELERSRPWMMKAVRKWFRDSNDSEDVVQRSLMRAWVHRESFRGESAIDSWLYVVLKNTAFMELRKMQTRSIIIPMEELEQLVAIDPAPNPEQLAVENSKLAGLMFVVRALPEPVQKGVQSYFSGCKITNTVRVQRHRARRVLRQIFQQKPAKRRLVA